MQTIQQFIDRHKITMSHKGGEIKQPFGLKDSRCRSAVWVVVLRMGESELVLPYFSHRLPTEPPPLPQVLVDLAAEAAAVAESTSFSDWASRYGLSADSRRAERYFEQARDLASDLHTWLGDGVYGELLWETER